MAQIRENLIVRLLQRGAIARWAAAARRATTADLDVCATRATAPATALMLMS
jgi:hypothetical protein|tara:strand:+ start:2879 stop:3034 length:156 start_codon:yes stop_codon:yes gene_type:complete